MCQQSAAAAAAAAAYWLRLTKHVDNPVPSTANVGYAPCLAEVDSKWMLFTKYGEHIQLLLQACRLDLSKLNN